MRKIPLTQGQFALVDRADFDLLARWKWCAFKCRKTYYAMRADYSSGKRKTILMHRLLLGVSVGVSVDHKDGNGLNNRRKNIRPATDRQNRFGRSKYRNGKSKFKGVCKITGADNWRAYIRKDKKRFHLGCFEKELEAAKAYDAAALRLFGEFARVNFP